MNQTIKSNRTLQKRLRNPLKDRYKANALKHKSTTGSIKVKKVSNSELEASKLRIQEYARQQRIKQILIAMVVLAALAILYWYSKGTIDWAKWLGY